MRKLLLLLAVPLMMLTACGGGGSDKSNSSGEPQSGLIKDIVGDDEYYSPSKWITSQDYVEGTGHFIYCACFSDNYYVIDGRKIALQYLFQILPEAKDNPTTSAMLFTCGFAFVDITGDDAQMKPSFGNNPKLYFTFPDGSNSTITTNIANDNLVNWYNPYAGKFQKRVNDAGGFTVQVTLKDGKKVTYNFNTSKRDKLKIENIE